MWRYAPDLPPDTPEIWQTCDGFHPDVNGVYRTGFIASTGTSLTANSAPLAGRYVYKIDGTEELIQVTSGVTSGAVAAQVFGGTTDRTGGVPRPIYNEGIVGYGNIVLISTATSGEIASRTIGAAANFASVASTPGADILLVNPLNIVIGLNTDAGADGWATSDVGDYTNWTTLEAASGNLRQTQGPITAGVVLGNDVIAFKNRGVYRGSYVGGIIKWQWQLVHSELGAFGPGCAVVAEDAVYFIGSSGFFRYDGASFSRMDNGISQTLLNFVSRSNVSSSLGYIKLIYDPPTKLIYVFSLGYVGLAVSGGGRTDSPTQSGKHYTFNVLTGQWGRQDYIKDDKAEKITAVYDGKILPLVEPSSGVANTPFAGTSIVVYDKTDSQFAGVNTTCSYQNWATYIPSIGTGKIGQRGAHTAVTRVIPRWLPWRGNDYAVLSSATTKKMTAYAHNSTLAINSQAATSTDVTLSGNQFWADYTKDSQFHAFDFFINEAVAIDGVEIETVQAGKY